MKFCSQELKLKSLSKEWDDHLWPNQVEGPRKEREKRISAALKAEGENLTLEKACKILNTDEKGECNWDHWAKTPQCNECGKKGAATIQLGEEPEIESMTAWICKECLEKALKLFL